jgi:DNA-binding transcriptional regulator YdaS (Cro superfamily)
MLPSSVMRDSAIRAGGGGMATRKNKLRLSEQELLSIAGDLGIPARVFNENEVRQLLRAAVERAGTQVAFAKRHGIDRTHLNQVLKGKSRVSGSVLKCLGLRKSYTIDQAAKPGKRTEAHSLAPALEHFEA